MLGSLGPLEIGVIVLLALLLFGAGRIASLGKGLGESIKNFRTAVRDEEE
jgi:sec-independent protein translocase protein TatA